MSSLLPNFFARGAQVAEQDARDAAKLWYASFKDNENQFLIFEENGLPKISVWSKKTQRLWDDFFTLVKEYNKLRREALKAAHK